MLKKSNLIYALPILLILIPLIIFISFYFIDQHKQRRALEQKIGQMFLIGFDGTTAEENSEIVKYIKKYNIGGVIYFDYSFLTETFDKNIKNPQQVQTLSANLQKYAPTKLLISVDVEGGKVNRFKPKYGFDTKVPTPQQIGKQDSPQATYKYAEKLATSLQNAGINMNFAPVLDLDLGSPIITKYERSFSTNPEKVYANAEQVIKAQNEKRIISVGKHFPGHGSAAGDTHKSLIDVTNTWTEEELKPFKQMIDNKKLDVIMTAHLLDRKIDEEYPASLSPKFVNDMLRKQLVFNGVVISDDLEMGALKDNFNLEQIIVHFINSGGDILLLSNIYNKHLDVVDDAMDIVIDNIENGNISMERIDESLERIKKLKEKYIL